MFIGVVDMDRFEVFIEDDMRIGVNAGEVEGDLTVVSEIILCFKGVLLTKII